MARSKPKLSGLLIPANWIQQHQAIKCRADKLHIVRKGEREKGKGEEEKVAQLSLLLVLPSLDQVQTISVTA